MKTIQEETLIAINTLAEGINSLTPDLFSQSDRIIRLRYPWVLVYVLERELKTKSGVLVNTIEANKPVHEGIVLSTWQPFTQEIGEKRKALTSAEKHKMLAQLSQKIRDDNASASGAYLSGVQRAFDLMTNEGIEVTKTVRKKSVFELGDHVLFQHWAGVPLHGFTDRKLRMVKEEDWQVNVDGGIFATIELSPVAESAKELLRAMLEDTIGNQSGLAHEHRINCRGLLEKICDAFMVIDRQAPSVTLSGV